MKFMNLAVSRLITLMLVIATFGFSANANAASYYGERDSVTLGNTGCNAVSNAPVPGEVNLFIGRQFFKSDGLPVTQEEGCSNTPEAGEATKAHRQGLVLERLNWDKKSFSLIKPLLATPAKVTGGPMKGAIIRSAYDPDVILYHGRYWVAFECVLENKEMFRVEGTSSCLAIFDLKKQEISLDTAYVVVSGKADSRQMFHAASVPHLIIFKDQPYIYWSELTVKQGKFLRSGVRGAELEADSKGNLWIKGVGGMAYSTGPGSVEVWGPDQKNKLSNSAVDVKSIWVSKDNVVALVSLGGEGCVAPDGPQPGCWRMAIAKANQPLGDHMFNKLPLLDEDQLPTNAQDYTRPIKNPNGGFSLMGSFYKPEANGFSDTRPAPRDWSKHPGRGQLIVFPFPDESLWPTN